MKRYRIKIDTEAFCDIREITNWYEVQSIGLGKRFQNAVIEQINNLTENPQIYAIRYKEIRCINQEISIHGSFLYQSKYFHS